MLGRIVKVIIDRPIGSYHPEYHDLYYQVNYGYIPEMMALDGEEQDAYVLGVDRPLTEFTGKVIAIVHRLNDCEDKLIVVPSNVVLSKEEIAQQVFFVEKFFEIEIIMWIY